MRELIPYFAIIFSALSLMLAALTFWRNGNWRQTDEGQKLIARIVAVEQAPDWHQTDSGKQIVGQVAEIRERLARGEERFANLATKADLARIESDVENLRSAIKGVDSGVIRIEQLLMNGGTK